jgi:hypothetical protein
MTELGRTNPGSFSARHPAQQIRVPLAPVTLGDKSGFLQQPVTPVPDQVRDDGSGVHVERLKTAEGILAIPATLPPSRPDEHGFLLSQE